MLRKLTTATLLLATLTLSAIPARAQPWNERHPTDKILHFVWGSATQATLSVGLGSLGVPYSPEIGLAGAVATGIGKELADKKFDPYDFAATAGGGLVSYAVDKLVRAKYYSDLPQLTVDGRRDGAILTVSGNFK